MKKTNHIAKEEIINKIWDNPPGECSLNAHEIREIMDAEMRKPLSDIDNSLVDRCSQLLCSLYQCEDDADVSEAMVAQSKQKLFARIDCKEKNAKWTSLFGRKLALRTIIASAVLFVIIGLVGIFATHGSLNRQHSEDGEDYITYGQTHATDTLKNAIANRTVDDDIYVAKSLTDVFTHLGYEITMPTWIPEKLYVSEASVSQDEVLDELHVLYQRDLQQVLYLDVDIIHDYAGVGIMREQNQPGEERVLSTGKTVYISQNVEKNWVLYSAERVVYQITSGHYDLDTLLQIIDSIGEQ